MTKKWVNWNENDLINESGADFVHSTKFKLLIFSFFDNFFLTHKFKNHRGFKFG